MDCRGRRRWCRRKASCRRGSEGGEEEERLAEAEGEEEEADAEEEEADAEEEVVAAVPSKCSMTRLPLYRVVIHNHDDAVLKIDKRIWIAIIQPLCLGASITTGVGQWLVLGLQWSSSAQQSLAA